MRNLNLMGGIRDRIGAVIGVAFLALMCFFSGAVLTFFISTQQAAEWRRIQNAPQLDAATFDALTTGDTAVVTGTLVDNPTILDDFVAYRVQEWDVEVDAEAGTANGDWETVETNYPALTLEITGGRINTLQTNSLAVGGSLTEQITESDSTTSAEGLPEGSTRVRGVRNGDLVTIVGEKASTGDLVPERVFAGDRVQLVDTIRTGARSAAVIGVVMMVLSPVILIGGGLVALLGRRR